MPQNINVHAMNLGELETEVLRKLWINTTEDSNGWSPDTAFSKYSRYRVRKKLNKNYTELAALTRSLRSWFIITLKSGYSQYPVPLNCWDIGEVYYFNGVTTYTKLDIYEQSIIEELLQPGWMTNPSIPAYTYVADRNKMVIKLGVAPAPNTDGTAIILDTGISAATGPQGAVEAVSGSAGLASAASTYVDSAGQNFSNLGVIAGLTILNVSDGSYGVISSISTTSTANDTLTVSAGLTGGSANTWTAGDQMRIIGGEYGNFMEIGDTDADYILSPTIGSLPSPGITMAAGNLLVRGFMLPTLLSDMNQYPELSPLFHTYIALGAAADLGQEEAADSPEYAQAQTYKADFTSGVAALSTFSATAYKTGTFQMWSVR